MTTPSEEVQFEIGSATHVGRKRKDQPNEDALEVVRPDPGQAWHPPLLLVADGLGKHYGGALASQLVVRTFKAEFKKSPHPTEYPALLQRCLLAAHQAVREKGLADPQLALMGSTLVAVVLTAQQAHLLNIGDSRAYLFRGRELRQISQDQTWVAAQVRAGVLTDQEARVHPNRNRLLMAITARRTEVSAHLGTIALEPQDVLLLCSDGLWGVVPESLIQSAAVELRPQVAADKLIALANNSRGPDNISVIVARQAAGPWAEPFDPDDTDS